MTTVPYTKGLHSVADGVWAWLAPDGGWGWSNAGLVAGNGASLLVDTLFDLGLTDELLSAVAGSGAPPITDVVNTHGNGDHCFGNSRVPPTARIHAAPGTAEHLRGESPDLLASMVAADLGPVLTPYVRHCFGAFDFSGIPLREPDQPVAGPASLDVGGRPVDLLPLGPAHTDSDVVVHVPDCRVVFTGDLLFIGGAPIAWAGPLSSWVAALDRVAALEPAVIVPGHGPVTDLDGLVAVQDYLRHVEDRARAAQRAGVPWEQAAADMDLGAFASWGESERVVVNTYNVYRHVDPDVPVLGVAELFTAMAGWWSTRGGGAEAPH